MANSIVSEIFRPRSFRAVDESVGFEVWRKLGVLSVNVLPDSQVADNPISITQYVSQDIFDDTTRIDSRNSKVIMPTKIQITAICDDSETISSVIQYFGNETSTLTIYSKEIVAESMCVVDVDVEQTPQRTSAMMLRITMVQTEEKVSSSFDPENPQDATTFGVRIERLGGSTLDQIAGGLSARARGIADSFTSGASNLYNKVRTYTGL